MSRFFVYGIVVLMMLCSSFPVLAQGRSDGILPVGQQKQTFQERFDGIKEKLNLTEEQIEKLTPLVKMLSEKLEAMMKNRGNKGSGMTNDMKTNMETVKQYHEQILTVLTEEQKEIIKSILPAPRSNKGGRGKGGGQGGGQGSGNAGS